MKYVPVFIARGPMLAQLVRNSAQDPRQRRLCSCCGARVVLTSARADQVVRCPDCQRANAVAERGDTPWRLTTASAEALRRTKSWARWRWL